MKSLIVAALAVSAAAIAAPASAQWAPGAWLAQPQFYATLGYTYSNPYNRDLGEITGRVGVKVGPFVGMEGELGTGVFQNRFTTAAGNHAKLSEGPSPAVYAVGYLPIGGYVPYIGSKLDVFGRVGYGETQLMTQVANHDNLNTYTSINYGGGVQYTMNGHDGLRFDYTRRDYQTRTSPGDDNTYALSYVHKF
jgi:outer membrane immunogenic protein